MPYEPRYKQVEQAAEQRTRNKGNNKVLPTMRFRRSRFGRRHNTAIRRYCNLRNEAVSPSREGFNVARRLGIVVKHLAQLLDVGIQAVFEIYECIFRPEVLAQFFAGDQFARTLQQKRKNGDGLALQLKLGAVLVQLGRLAVELKRSETDLLLRGWDWQMNPTIAANPGLWPTTTAKNLAQKIDGKN